MPTSLGWCPGLLPIEYEVVAGLNLLFTSPVPLLKPADGFALDLDSFCQPFLTNRLNVRIGHSRNHSRNRQRSDEKQKNQAHHLIAH